MTSPVTPSDVEDRWRPLAESEVVQVSVLIADAWAILQTQVPTLAARITAGTVDQGVVRFVVTSMVLRVMRNPEGYRSTTRTIDDFTESFVRDNTLAAGSLYATPEELALLRPPQARRHTRGVRLSRPVPYGSSEPYWLQGWDAW